MNCQQICKHAKRLNRSENIAKSFREGATFLKHCISTVYFVQTFRKDETLQSALYN